MLGGLFVQLAPVGHEQSVRQSGPGLPRGTIGPAGTLSRIDIANGKQAAERRNLIFPFSPRIACAVASLMMAFNGLQKPAAAREQAARQARARKGVRLDQS